MIKARAVADVVYLGEKGEGTIGSWSETSPGRASLVAALINRAITATVQDAPHPSGNDGTERLCRAVYGRKALPRDYIGGSEARMLHGGADTIERLREALTWAVRFIECQCPRTAGGYPDYHNAHALMMGQPLTMGPFWHASAEAELLRAENDRLREALKPLAAEYQVTFGHAHFLVENVLLRRAKEALEAKP